MLVSPVLRVFLLSLVVSASALPRGSTRGARRNLKKDDPLELEDLADEDDADEDEQENEDFAVTDVEMDGISFPQMDTEPSAPATSIFMNSAAEVEPIVQNPAAMLDVFVMPPADSTVTLPEDEPVTMPEVADPAVMPDDVESTAEVVESTVEVVESTIEDVESTVEDVESTIEDVVSTGTTPENPSVEPPVFVDATAVQVQSEPMTIEYSFSMTVGGQAVARDLGLSDYLSSQLAEKYPTLTDVQLTLVNFQGNTVSYEIDAVFSSKEFSGNVKNDIAALLQNSEALNAYWASNEGVIGNGLTFQAISLPEPEAIFLEDVILRNFTVTVEGRPTAQDLGLPVYLMEQMSETPVEKVYIEMFEYDGGNTVNYMGYANFSEPVNPEEVYALQYQILQDITAINSYYDNTVEFNGPLKFTAIDVDYVPTTIPKVDSASPDSEPMSTETTAYNIDLADFVVIVEGEGSSVVEDLGLSDYLEDRFRNEMPEIIDVTFTVTENALKPGQVDFTDGVAVFESSDGEQYSKIMVVEAQIAVLENIDAINAFWAADPDVDLRVRSLDIDVPIFYRETKDWVIGVTVGCVVAACACIIFFMPRA